MEYTRKEIAAALDYAVLKPTATESQIKKAAILVQQNDIASLCVAPSWVSTARLNCTRVCSVVGFPHGNTTPLCKYNEACHAIFNGAFEVDVVINYGHFLDNDWKIVEREVKQIVTAAHGLKVPVKTILETCYYNTRQIQDAARLCMYCGADYIKTSTGFGTGGATPEAIEAILQAVGGKVKIKASGGIKTYADVKLYLDLGCSRIGASTFEELLP